MDDNEIDLDLIESRLDTLRPVTRAVFLLKRIDGLNYEEIAWRFGISVEAVEKHMAKAIYRITWPSWRESEDVLASYSIERVSVRQQFRPIAKQQLRCLLRTKGAVTDP